jgi:hypothetical protein
LRDALTANPVARHFKAAANDFPSVNRQSQSGDKSAALQTLRDQLTPAELAKRLECGRLQRRSRARKTFAHSGEFKNADFFLGKSFPRKNPA